MKLWHCFTPVEVFLRSRMNKFFALINKMILITWHLCLSQPLSDTYHGLWMFQLININTILCWLVNSYCNFWGLAASSLFFLGLYRPWIWQQQVPLRRSYLFNKGNHVVFQKTWKCTNTTVRTSNIALLFHTFYGSDILQYRKFARNWHNWVAYI